jgi:competence protein ComEC
MCRRKRPWLLTGCAVFCLVISVAASWVEPQLDRFRITILDVGQGQSIILQHNDSYYLVDCGGDSGMQAADAAAQQLFSQGIFSLDGLILTHYDMDHAGGVLPLLSRMDVDTLYCPDIDPEHETRIQLEEAYGHKIHWISFDSQYRIDETSISLLTTHEKTSGNESSMCVLFQPENCDILITGDRGKIGERALVAQYQLPQLEVLLVGHHGGKNSTTLELLHETWPKMAIISVGVNGYGHPTEDVLERLERFGCQIMRTDLDGTIIVRG